MRKLDTKRFMSGWWCGVGLVVCCLAVATVSIGFITRNAPSAHIGPQRSKTEALVVDSEVHPNVTALSFADLDVSLAQTNEYDEVAALGATAPGMLDKLALVLSPAASLERQPRLAAHMSILAAGLVCTYTHLAQRCVHHHNIIKYSGKTVGECKQLCLNRADCKAFEYGVDYGGQASNRYQPRDCQLQDSADETDCNGQPVNLDLYKKVCTAATATPTEVPTLTPTPTPTEVPTTLPPSNNPTTRTPTEPPTPTPTPTPTEPPTPTPTSMPTHAPSFVDIKSLMPDFDAIRQQYAPLSAPPDVGGIGGVYSSAIPPLDPTVGGAHSPTVTHATYVSHGELKQAFARLTHSLFKSLSISLKRLHRSGQPQLHGLRNELLAYIHQQVRLVLRTTKRGSLRDLRARLLQGVQGKLRAYANAIHSGAAAGVADARRTVHHSHWMSHFVPSSDSNHVTSTVRELPNELNMGSKRPKKSCDPLRGWRFSLGC